MYKYLLFDLDGTISDSGPGITKSVQHALRYYGIEVEDLNELKKFVGPPLRNSFMEFYNISQDDIEECIIHYRERYSTVGLFENELYPGMDTLLRDLHNDGRVLLLASSKPRVYVEKILEHFNVLQYFDVVMGSEFNGANEAKIEIIKECLRKAAKDEAVDINECVMIGDRKFDIDAANEINMPNIGVSYGFGSVEELTNSKANVICNTVDELRETLFAN